MMSILTLFQIRNSDFVYKNQFLPRAMPWPPSDSWRSQDRSTIQGSPGGDGACPEGRCIVVQHYSILPIPVRAVCASCS
jgi:hypothetical protein